MLARSVDSIDNFEDYSQFTQELRLVSKGNDTLDYIVGARYFDGDMDFTQDFQWLIPFNFNRHEVAASTTESIAAFGQIDWHINEAVNLTLGARVTDEERTGFRQQVVRQIYTENERRDWCNNQGSTGGMGPPPGPRTCTAGNDGLQPLGTPLTGEFSDTVTSWNASLQWSPDDNSMFYVSAATGFKSGGFDLRGAGDPTKFVFPKEESMQYELGGKHTLADGRLRVNWALFQLEIDDLQLSTNDPILIQQVVGQAEVTSKGFEWDTVWAVTDEFNLTWTGAYLDSTYDRFRSNCYLLQTAAQGCDNGTQDLSGQRLVFTPEWTSVAGADYTWAVSNDMEVTVSGKWIYIDSFENMVDKDPRAVSDSSSRFDATIALSGNIGEANPWSVALVGRNLSDELVRQWCNSSGLSGAPVVSCTVEEPRYVALRATFGF